MIVTIRCDLNTNNSEDNSLAMDGQAQVRPIAGLIKREER